MIMIYSWRGAGIAVLVIFPVLMFTGLIASVNLIGKDFTRENFRLMAIGGLVVSGIVCFLLGRWLNRHRVVKIKDGHTKDLPETIGNYHQMWHIPFQHWCWVYFGLSIFVDFLWEK